MSQLSLIIKDSLVLGWQYAATPAIGTQLIPLEQFEVEYIQQNLKPYFTASGTPIYMLCEADENPVMSLNAGYHLRRRTDNELANDPDNPMYPTLWVRVTMSGGDGRDPVGCPLDGSLPITVDFDIFNDDGEVVPVGGSVGYAWRVPVYTDAGEEIDTFEITLINGSGTRDFVPYAGTLCRKHLLSSKDFDLVKIGGIYHQIKIVDEPIVFKVYR